MDEIETTVSPDTGKSELEQEVLNAVIIQFFSHAPEDVYDSLLAKAEDAAAVILDGGTWEMFGLELYADLDAGEVVLSLPGGLCVPVSYRGRLPNSLIEELKARGRAPKVEDEVPDSNLYRHALRELELLAKAEGADDIYGGMIDRAVLELMAVFVKQGHSGMSASIVVPIFARLAAWKNLTPITDNPDEWQEVGDGMWQSKRSPELFSEDGGKTYGSVDEGGRDQRPVHESKAAVGPVKGPEREPAASKSVDISESLLHEPVTSTKLEYVDESQVTESSDEEYRRLFG